MQTQALPEYATVYGKTVRMNTKKLQLVTYDEGTLVYKHRWVNAAIWLIKHPIVDPKKLTTLQPVNSKAKGNYLAVVNITKLNQPPRMRNILLRERKCVVCGSSDLKYVCRKTEVHKLCGTCANLGIRSSCPLCSFVVGAKLINEG